jgi:hypothetical protein
MSAPWFIDLEGRRYLWHDVLATRRAQLAAIRKAEQPALFELRDDRRPVAERTVAGRYREPSLFTVAEKAVVDPRSENDRLSNRSTCEIQEFCTSQRAAKRTFGTGQMGGKRT